eukprot:NODE_137_length_16306_cov_0.462640.p11 type:complete len:106 gc:universal NODE_137_length_16306_cov_0.462640:5881-6198(+)
MGFNFSKQNPEFNPNGNNLTFDVFNNCDFESRLKIRELTKITPNDEKQLINYCCSKLPRFLGFTPIHTLSLFHFPPYIVFDYVDKIMVNGVEVQIWIRKHKFLQF